MTILSPFDMYEIDQRQKTQPSPPHNLTSPATMWYDVAQSMQPVLMGIDECLESTKIIMI